MPIYEYECENCGHHFEQLQKVSDKPLKECPKCGKPTLHKLISAAGFQLKGTGWYATDFKDKGTKPKETSKKDSADNVCPTTGKKCDGCCGG